MQVRRRRRALPGRGAAPFSGGNGIIDAPWAAQRYSVTYHAARDALERLASQGIVREVRRTGRTRRLFVCDGVLRELDN